MYYHMYHVTEVLTDGWTPRWIFDLLVTVILYELCLYFSVTQSADRQCVSVTLSADRQFPASDVTTVSVTCQLIGSSLLVMYDNSDHANVWMIDFAKTVPVPDHVLTHRDAWQPCNHEEGYLTGLDNLLTVSLFHHLHHLNHHHNVCCGKFQSVC